MTENESGTEPQGGDESKPDEPDGTQGTKKEQEPKPPWGSNDEFDPDKAWKLIQNLRGDLDKVKSSRDELHGKVQEFEDRDKTEAQRLAEAKEQAAKDAAEAKAEAARLRVAMKYGLEEDDLDLLGSGDEEQIEARAKRLAERFTPKDDDAEVRRRPRERLRPGAAPASEPEENDPIKLAAQVPRY